MNQVDSKTLWKSIAVGVVGAFAMYFASAWEVSQIILALAAGTALTYFAYGKFANKDLF